MRVPKWPFIFLELNAKFYSCTQTAIRYFTAKYKILQLYSNDHHFFTVKCKISKLFPNSHFSFLQRNTKFWRLHPNGHSFFTTKYRIFKVVPKQPFVFPTRKKVYKNIDYRKLVPGLYNGFLKPVVYCRKKHCKKVSPQFFSVLYKNISIF